MTGIDEAVARVEAFLPEFVDVPDESVPAQLGAAMFAGDIRAVLDDRAQLLERVRVLENAIGRLGQIPLHDHDRHWCAHDRDISRALGDAEPAPSTDAIVGLLSGLGERARTAQPAPLRAVLAENEILRQRVARAHSFRLTAPSTAVDPAVHTPERVAAYLTARGWVRRPKDRNLWDLGHSETTSTTRRQHPTTRSGRPCSCPTSRRSTARASCKCSRTSPMRSSTNALVDQLTAESDPPRLEWATLQRWPSDGHEEICGPSTESLARRRFAEYPAMHRALLQRTVTYGPWTEVASKDADDA